ncbi:MAG: ABC transporter ATP-binding protein [Proteobacteria bacterium]|nr:ABC transporter ATP-binding protein [Pseudomonadota bacterium]
MRQVNSPRPAEPAPSLSVRGMSKAFNGVPAIEDISIDVGAGEFHGLLGENGAGKSTLVKGLLGFHLPDAGRILVNDAEVSIRRPADAHALGLGMVYQHFTSVPALTAFENLLVSRHDAPKVIDWSRECEDIRAFMSRMPFSVPLDVPVGSLAAGQRQKLEILKLLYLGSRFIVLDEPTSVLTPQEADEVLGLLREMTQARAISALMITHKFREVTAYCDRVTVLRRGRMAGAGSVREVDTQTMARWMVGDAAAPAAAGSAGPAASAPGTPATPTAAAHGQPALDLIELRSEDDLGMPALDGLSLRVHPGELVGLAGVSGNGQTFLLDAISGQRKVREGSIKVHGKPYEPTRRQSEECGVRTLPEEPLKNGGVARMSVVENLALRTFDRAPMSNRWGWLKPSALHSQGRALIDEFRVRTPSPDAPLEALSGGNVQRVVLARELSGQVRVLVVANPCFGLDFLTAAQIRQELRAQRDRGVAVLLISEDLDEILMLSDRVAVISGGRIVMEAEAGTTSRMAIGAAMAAHGGQH